MLVVLLHRHGSHRGRQRLRERLDPLPVGEEALLARIAFEQALDDVARRSAAFDNLQVLAEGDELLEPLFQFLAAHLGPVRQHHDARFDGALHQPGLERALVADEDLALAALGAEERRLRDVDVAELDERPHLPVEERQQQRADVRTVHVRVGHDDDAVVALLGHVEIFLPDAASERGDHRLDFVAAEHAIEPRPLDVEDLALDRQDRLEAAIASLLGGAAGRLAFDDVDLAQGRVAFLAIGQLAGQAAAVERALAPDEVARLARRFARARRVDRLADRRAWRPPGSPRERRRACR